MARLETYLLSALIFYSTVAMGQTDRQWTLVSTLKTNQKNEFPINSNYRTYKISEAYNTELRKSISNTSNDQELIISLPLPDGTIESFRVSQNQIISGSLQLEYPSIKSFTGRGLKNKNHKVFLDFSHRGLNAMIYRGSSIIYIDRDYNNRPLSYLSYFRKDAQHRAEQSWSCAQDPEDKDNHIRDQKLNTKKALSKKQRKLKTSTIIKEYRIAVATTSEYTTFFGGTVADGLAAVVTAINRVSGIYETEMGIRFNLIANNNLLIYTDALNDPWGNNNNDLNLVQNEIDNTIGSANYDIGHIFTTSPGGRARNGVCDDSHKAEGLTGLVNPTGDAFYVDYVAHEIGHQFKASHTFNGAIGVTTCLSSRRSESAYEPGSGSTIMAYAGICGADNIQNNSDALFHLKSLQQIEDFTIDEATCYNGVSTSNNTPSVDANVLSIDGKVIPASTPFELEGSGSDPDGDQIMYEWSQWDLGPQQEISQGDNGMSPIFRTWPTSAIPKRTLPRLEDLVDNSTSPGETLPTSNRDLNFQLTARDQKGSWAHDSISISVSNSAGPFQITNLNTSASISGNTTLTWDVAGTTANGINCGSVDIFLSTDGGLTYPITLALNEANDGSANITIPEAYTQAARLKIKCSNNIFFDINNANLSIEPDCNTTTNISNNPIVDNTYSSATQLTSTGVIPANGQVIFTGKNSIDLLPNFMINQSGALSIFIIDCN